jgi:hypothetical protein
MTLPLLFRVLAEDYPSTLFSHFPNLHGMRERRVDPLASPPAEAGPITTRMADPVPPTTMRLP